MCVGGHCCNWRAKSLVVLSLLKSHISQLPREIGLLTCLRLLDLSNCSKLEVIPPNVLSSLVALEELYMGNSFVQCEAEGLNNASLAGLNNLSHLITLEIHIPDISNLPKDLLFEQF
jgi:Leucine-rich repeat (LRR) protein